ncbi:ATP-binding protein [Sporosarcina sp. HYO08]|uniref:ATP-binding protein n=1 Tax=Sporosarcina sp. HYO08 TaxID=1759557 RepID=UPI000796D3F2|nr:ATP-binding protein [Sporosarcina sp. HYO08]KXH79816.1 hypothetical protein AU377_10045 [Sporosarcina sp. HYO08]
MKFEKFKEEFSYVMNDTIRPGAVLELDGTIACANNPFLIAFGNDQLHNVEELLDDASYKKVKSFIQKAIDMKCNTFDEVSFTLTLHHHEKKRVNGILFYSEEKQKVNILFDNPGNLKNVPVKSYENVTYFADFFVMIVDEEGIIRDINNKHLQYFNKPREFFVGQSYEVLAEFYQHDNSYKTQISLNGYDERIHRIEIPPGEVRYYHMFTYYDKETAMYYVRICDCTEMINMEQQLAHLGTLSTVGQLAASIAHEIRNPMTTLKGFVQLLKISARDEAQKYLSVIDSEIERMEIILSEMLVLSKPSEKEKTPISLQKLLTNVIQILYPQTIKDRLTIDQVEFTGNSSIIYGNGDRIKQVLLNLFKNSLEAMSPGGTLTIELVENEKEQLVLTIGDTGAGISAKQIDRIFTPFFTSKVDGTGLGLPFVKKTVEEHGGKIAVESEEGKGTVFTLVFPQLSPKIIGQEYNKMFA